MNENIPNLNIEFQSFKDTGDQILLEQDNCLDYVDRITIHPIHLRYMAEKLGLVASSDAQVHSVIESLQRRLVTLKDRVDHLTDYLTRLSDDKHANLDYERTYSRASSDIAEQFCMDIEWLNDTEEQS